MLGLKKTSLATKTMIALMAASLAMFLILDSLTLLNESRKLHAEADQRVTDRVQRILPALEVMAWNFDSTAIESLLTGLAHSGSLIEAELVMGEQTISVHRKAEGLHIDRTWTVPVTAPGKKTQIGVLHIFESDAELNRTIKRQLLITSLTELIKIIGVTVVIYFIVSRIITIPLAKLAKEVGELASTNGDVSIQLQLQRHSNHAGDELDTLVNAINHFRNEKELEIHRRREAEHELRQHQERLEEKVAARTALLETANKDLDAFAYTVAHDLRTPLRSINGYAAILKEDYTDLLQEDGCIQLQRIMTATKHMSLLIDDLLNMAHVSRLDLRKQHIDLGELAQTSFAELKNNETQRHVNVRIAAGLKAHGDCGLMQIAMNNLIGNAWKYTGKRAEAEIELGVKNANGEKVYFVRDNGVGFDMKYAGKLFGAFQRLHGSQDFKGTGIGLATVAQIIKRHGGRIWAEAEVDKGATFFFTLPEQPTPN